MKNINNEVFFNKINQRINNGDFDSNLSLPFMSRSLLLYTIRGKLDKKILTGSTPILGDLEIKECIEEVKETALNIISLYLKLGFMEKTEEGYVFSKAFSIAIKAAYQI